MAGYQGCISLALVCLWLCHHSLAVPWNSKPCQTNTENNNAYDDFLRKHVPKRTPAGSDNTVWHAFITGAKLLRATQSFLSHADEQRVKEVCSDTGGLWYKGNMCISRETFTFTTVHYNTTTNTVTSVISERKHLILGCDKVENQCLPVHFQAYDDKKTSGAYKLPCESGKRPLDLTHIHYPAKAAHNHRADLWWLL